MFFISYSIFLLSTHEVHSVKQCDINTVLGMKIWIYWCEYNSWIYFIYIYLWIKTENFTNANRVLLVLDRMTG